MMEVLDASGTFWSPDDDARYVYGTVFWEPGSKTRIQLDSRVIDEQAKPIEVTGSGISVTHTGKPVDIVADGVPRVLFGNTESGPVTCTDCYLRHSPIGFDVSKLFAQEWEAHRLVVGAHLPAGNTANLNAVRFILGGPEWWRHLPDSGSAMSGAGEITCDRSDDGLVWLTFRPSYALTLRSAEHAIVSVKTLVKLAVDADLPLLRVQIREGRHTDWLDVKMAGTEPGEASRSSPGNLLPPSCLTLERIAAWMTIEQTMDGLTAAVAHPIKGQAMQVQALVACSLVEGLHKRIVSPYKRDYIERVRDLHEMAQLIDPDVTSPVENWGEVVRNTRNDLAHHNMNHTFDQQFYNWSITEASAIWVLRLCLLSHAGFSEQEIAEQLKHHQRYEFYRQNLIMHVKESASEG